MGRLYWLSIFSIVIGSLIVIFVILYGILWYMAKRHVDKEKKLNSNPQPENKEEDNGKN